MGSLLLLFAWERTCTRILLPRNSTYQQLVPKKKRVVEAASVAMLGIFFIFIPAFLAMRETPNPSESVGELVPVSRWTVTGCGMAVGFLVFDLLHMMAHDLTTALFVVHHVVSIAVWPYAALTGKAHYYLNFLMFTEVTSIGQHGRILIDSLGLKQHPIRILNGAVWMISFFLVRLVPVPYLVWEQLIIGQNLQVFSSVDHAVLWLTFPIPVMMNSYWFYLIATGLVSAVSPKPDKTKTDTTKTDKD
eukprot:TRINITY_DN26693_c0_g1_i3.p1 TRINITY_DN26693_c0_g1~~TRINITY_DN26693_c0_g1_i3.p1  ORF type:complete len:247 (-),score=43.07 TRINITY_DN26693_c0_g1_i3:195-935(-)